MTNERTGLYEGIFLFPQSATVNLQEAIDHLKEILENAGATIINFRKWDDRRLAYEIEGNKRGVYFLVYFNAPTSIISDLERRCNQSELILRMMLTRAEHLPSEIIDANEGSEDLASEIKLRGEKKIEKNASAGSQVSKKEEKTAPAPENESETSAPETASNSESEEPEAVVAEEKNTPNPESEEPEAVVAEEKNTPNPESEEPEAVVAKEITETEEVTEA